MAEGLTGLSIVALVSSPVTNLLTSVPQVAGTLGCFTRIEEYLISKDLADDRVLSFNHRTKVNEAYVAAKHDLDVKTLELQQIEPVQPHDSGPLVSIVDASFGLETPLMPTFSKINLNITHGSLTMIIGPVGSGKSKLLKSILGEIPCREGTIALQSKSVSYCDQEAWLQNGTFRHNILGDKELDEHWYRLIIFVCALQEDFDNLPDGDISMVGHGGMALSGGQKQRLVRDCFVRSIRRLRLIKVDRHLREHYMQDDLCCS
jgi:ATP-binding cassette subfamily C (CFTR/MRP) protein 1